MNLGANPDVDELDPAVNNYVRATEEDWHTIILPGVRKYLTNDNFKPWEVDEWCRQLDKVRQDRSVYAALCMLRDDLMSGTLAPAEWRRFIPEWKAPGYEDDEEAAAAEAAGARSRKVTVSGFEIVDGSPEATQRLLADWKTIQTTDCKKMGFHALPIGKNLYLWNFMIFGFDNSTPLGQDLASFATIHASPSATSAGRAVKPFDILFEVKFSKRFPQEAPMFRLVRPRFQSYTDANLFKHLFEDLHSSSAPSSSSSSSSSAALASSGHSHLTTSSNVNLSVSVQLEQSTKSHAWNPEMPLLELFNRIQQAIKSDPDIRVDMQSSKDGISTVGNFWQSFVCCPASTQSRTDAEMGGKILLPATALEDLYPNNGGFYNRYNAKCVPSLASPNSLC